MAKRKASRDPLAGLTDRAKEYTKEETQTEETYVQEKLKGRRKRRSDATWPEGATDKHKGSSTLSVRMPDELAQQVRAAASADGQSVNAWLLGLIRGYFGG